MSYNYFPYTTTTSGTTYTLANVNNTSTWASITANGDANLTPNSLQVKGKAEFEHEVNIEGDLRVQGKSIKESLEAIEARLAILHPNEKLEEKWEQLRGLRQMYMELEAEIIEKEKMWAILKK